MSRHHSLVSGRASPFNTAIHKPGSGVHPALWPVGGEPPIELTGFALLLEGDAGTDRILLEGDAQAGTDILLLEGTM